VRLEEVEIAVFEGCRGNGNVAREDVGLDFHGLLS
jgi:hypothetical protein